MHGTQHGKCSICNGTFKLTLNGVITRHGGKRKGNECLGSYTLPVFTFLQTPLLTTTPSNTLTPTDNKPSNSVIFNFDCQTDNLPRAHTNTSPNSSVNNHPASQLYQFLQSIQNITTFKFIPKAARTVCRRKLTSIFNSICDNAASDNLNGWLDLFSFAKSILYITKLKQSKSITVDIKNRVASFQGTNSLPLNYISDSKISRGKRDALMGRVRDKMEQGNMRAAVRLLADDASLAPATLDTIEKLKDKHPPSNGVFLPVPSLTTKCLEVDSAQIIKSIRSFPSGSSGGLDGLRPQHLKDLIDGGPECQDFVNALTNFINLTLKGQINSEIRSLFFGGNLTALSKKNGDIRPIAVGSTLRRVASKCANNFACNKLTNYFAPRQLGVGVKGGAEAAVHTARKFLSHLQHKCFIKIDFKNAFNSIFRSNMLREVHKHIEEIYNYCFMNYCDNITLNYNGTDISSQRGVQQGDPLGPFLFALTIHPILLSLNSECVLGFLDDISLGGESNTVEEDFISLESKAVDLGLSLNENKCEYISNNINFSPLSFHKFLKLEPFEAELLGAAILKGVALDNLLIRKKEALIRIMGRLSLISSHDALVILKYALSAPKLIYCLRCSPCLGSPILKDIDEIFKIAICKIANVDLSQDAWLQASLPIRLSGLGVRTLESLAPSCFLASFHTCDILIKKLLPPYLLNEVDSIFDDYLNYWQYNFLTLPEVEYRSSQRSWDRPGLIQTFNSLVERANSSTSKARLLALTAPHSGDWLQAWPLTSCGLRLSDSEIRVSVALRLGVKICEEHKCVCGATIDTLGLHGLACRRSAGRHSRHSMVNEIIEKALTAIHMPCIREPIGLSINDNLRPDGCTLIPWKQGRCMAWDVTIPDTLAPSHIINTSTLIGAAASLASQTKHNKYKKLKSTYYFCPIAIETLGPMNEEGFSLLKTIAKKLVVVRDDPLQYNFFFQRISCAIQRGNHLSILNSLLKPSNAERATF